MWGRNEFNPVVRFKTIIKSNIKSKTKFTSLNVSHKIIAVEEKVCRSTYSCMQNLISGARSNMQMVCSSVQMDCIESKHRHISNQ